MMKTCKICGQNFERLATHVTRTHGLSFEDYLIEQEFGGIRPKCACGCGKDVPFSNSQGMRILTYIHGHSARAEGRLTEESKRKIGEKNSRNLKEWYEENPEKKSLKNRQLCSGITPEVRKRSAKTNSKNWHLPESTEKRQKQIDSAISLLGQGKIGPQAPFKAEWINNPFTHEEEYMHSSWETRFLQECVKEKIPVTKKHDVKIDYIDPHNVQRTYIPDFVSLDGKKIFEVKGQETETDLTKYEAAKIWCDIRGAVFSVVRYK